jgi:aminomethyltransferase
VIAEHTAVRESVGLFDVSHLGKAAVRGPAARAFVNACLSNDLSRIEPGKAQYTLCCAPSGGVVDDMIAYLIGDDEVFLVPNAANTAEVVRLLAEAAPEAITVEDQHRDFGVLAVQGPRSAQVLDQLGVDRDMDYMAYADATIGGHWLRVCRSGYTGEHGYELVTGWADTPALWDSMLAAVHKLGGLPAGLGARDTLRTEMGLPLHGQDLSLEISPVQARASFAVGWKKDAFFGREALLAEREAGPIRRLWGIESLERGIPRPHMAVCDADGAQLGEVTSGTFSPTLGYGFGLALLSTADGIEEGRKAVADIRGRSCEVRVVKPPFVDSHVR